jgi:DNA-binding NarL/FixJ family response regulator
MSVHRTFHTLLVEDDQSDTQHIYELVAGVPSVQFTWENVIQLEEAKELLRTEPFDLVLIDLSLPDSQGLDTFIHLHPHTLCLPVVILTEKDDELLALQAVRSGAQDYLVKGQMEGNALVRSLSYAVERKRLVTALHARTQQLTLLMQQLSSKARIGGSLDDLIVSFVNELNNPLATVSAQLEELIGQFDPQDTKLDTLQAIQGEVEQMVRLVGGLLQASLKKIESEKTATTGQTQDLPVHGAELTRSQEATFFEALGAWVLEYISSNNMATSHSIDQLLQQMKKDRATSLEPLSQREHQVIYLVAKGYINREIAKQLSLSVRTVERYSASVMNKLGLHNRAELITYAVREGIVNGNDVLGLTKQ